MIIELRETDRQPLTRGQAFREHIIGNLSAQAPTDDAEQIRDLSISVLRELYPNIWYFGPRGDTYLRQLDQIETLMDRIEDNPEDTAFLSAFSNGFGGGLVGIPNPARNVIASSARLHQYPDVNLGWIGDEGRTAREFEVEDPTIFIGSNHVLWDNVRDGTLDPEDLAWMQAIETFTYLSLFNPLIQQHTGQRHLRSYNMFCSTWGIEQ